MNYLIHRVSAVAPTIRKYIKEANRFRLLRFLDGSFRVELYSVSTCRHCGCEALDPNWPVNIDFSEAGLSSAREVLRENMVTCKQTETNPDTITMLAPEDYCAGCWTRLGLE